MPSQKITSMKTGMKLQQMLFFSLNFQHSVLSLDPCYPPFEKQSSSPSFIPYSCYRQSKNPRLAWIVWRQKCPHSQMLCILHNKSTYFLSVLHVSHERWSACRWGHRWRDCGPRWRWVWGWARCLRHHIFLLRRCHPPGHHPGWVSHAEFVLQLSLRTYISHKYIWFTLFD